MSERQGIREWHAPRSRRWSEHDGRAMLTALARSGESVGQFARRHEVDAQRLRYWVGRLGPTRAAAQSGPSIVSAVPVMFAPVRLVGGGGDEEAAADAAVIDIRVGAAVVRIGVDFDPALLRRVVAALGGASC